MRTITFQSVLEGVLRRLGIDPAAEHLGHDTTRAVTEHINTRLATAWTAWPWKELEVTSERAFRPLWDVLTAYKEDDEFYFVTETGGTYYRTLNDSAAGVDPSKSAAFEIIEAPLYRLIPFQQTGAEEIGQVYGVFPTDPHDSTAGTRQLRSLGYRQTEDGVEINFAPGINTTGDTVFLTYRAAPPVFTSVPFAEGKTYKKGDIAYFPAEGECNRLVTPADPEEDTDALWEVVKFPAMFGPYVKLGATHDALLETGGDDGLSAEQIQMRLAKATRLDAQAERLLSELSGRQVEQGQRTTYRRFGTRTNRRWLYAA